MNKTIVVIDMPNSCDECLLFGSFYSDLCCKVLNKRGINYPYPKDFRQNWCPLESVPSERLHSGNPYDDYGDGYADGYNACLDEILGGL